MNKSSQLLTVTKIELRCPKVTEILANTVKE